MKFRNAKEWMPEEAVQSTDARLSSMEPHATLACGPITAGS